MKLFSKFLVAGLVTVASVGVAVAKASPEMVYDVYAKATTTSEYATETVNNVVVIESLDLKDFVVGGNVKYNVYDFKVAGEDSAAVYLGVRPEVGYVSATVKANSDASAVSEKLSGVSYGLAPTVSVEYHSGNFYVGTTTHVGFKGFSLKDSSKSGLAVGQAVEAGFQNVGVLVDYTYLKGNSSDKASNLFYAGLVYKF